MSIFPGKLEPKRHTSLPACLPASLSVCMQPAFDIIIIIIIIVGQCIITRVCKLNNSEVCIYIYVCTVRLQIICIVHTGLA